MNFSFAFLFSSKLFAFVIFVVLLGLTLTLFQSRVSV